MQALSIKKTMKILQNICPNRKNLQRFIREMGLIKAIIGTYTTITTISITRRGTDEITGMIDQETITTSGLSNPNGKRHLLIFLKKGDVLFNLQNYLFSRCICQQI